MKTNNILLIAQNYCGLKIFLLIQNKIDLGLPINRSVNQNLTKN